MIPLALVGFFAPIKKTLAMAASALAMLISGVQAAPVVLSLSPSVSSKTVGDTFSLDVKISGSMGTFSATATTNAWFGLHLTNSDTVGHAITIPSSYSMQRNATVTSFVIPASSQLWLIWRYDGTTAKLEKEITVNAVTASTTVASDSGSVTFDNLALISTESLWVSVTVANDLNVYAQCSDL